MDKISVDLILQALSGQATSEEVGEVISYINTVRAGDAYEVANNVISSLENSNFHIVGNGNIIGNNNRLIYIEQSGARDIADAIWNLRTWYAQTDQAERARIFEDEMLSYVLRIGSHPEFSPWGKEKYFDLLLRQDKSIFRNKFTFEMRKSDDIPEDCVSKPETIQEAINKYKQLLLIGPPGSGKTTALKSLMLNYANDFLEEDSSKILPVFLWLPNFNYIHASDPFEKLMGAIKTSMRKFDLDPSDTELRELIRRNRILLLLDGLNEIGDENSDSFLVAIDSLLNSYPSILIVITSRVYNLQLTKGKLPVLEILELQYPDGIQDYLSRYLARQSDVRSLMELFADNLRLRQLAGNPLLLSMIVLIFQNQRGEIPDDRSALLEKISYGLLGQWGRDIKDLGGHFWFEDKHRLLQKLGYAMKSEGLELRDTRVKEILVEALESDVLISHSGGQHPVQFREITNNNLDQLIDELKHDRVLSDIGDTGRIRFWHQALQEYFVATYILKNILTFVDTGLAEINRAELRRYIRDENWHEILSLAGGLILCSDKILQPENLFSTYIKEIWRRNRSLAALCLSGKPDTLQISSYVKMLEKSIFLWGLYIPRTLPWFLLLALITLIWLVPEPGGITENLDTNAFVLTMTLLLGTVLSLLFFRLYTLLLKVYDAFAYRRMVRPAVLALWNIRNDIAERALIEFDVVARYDFSVSDYVKEMMLRNRNLLKRTQDELITMLDDSNYQLQAIEHLGQSNTFESRQSLVNLLRMKSEDLDWLEFNTALQSIIRLSKLQSEWRNTGDIVDILKNLARNPRISARKRLKACATLRSLGIHVKFPGLYKIVLLPSFVILLIVTAIVIVLLLSR